MRSQTIADDATRQLRREHVIGYCYYVIVHGNVPRITTVFQVCNRSDIFETDAAFLSFKVRVFLMPFVIPQGAKMFANEVELYRTGRS